MILTLSEFIDSVSINTNAHICIHDMSGFTSQKPFNLPISQKIHSAKLCSAAKSTKNGMKLCFACKALATKKATRTKEMFCGKCPFKITEIVLPIVYNGSVCANIYVGNIITDYKEFKENAEKISRITKTDSKKYIKSAYSCEKCSEADIEKYIKIAKSINSYVLLLFKTYGFTTASHSHWIVPTFADYASKYSNCAVSLSKLSKIYGANPKYAGRIFKKQMGVSFNSYLNGLRIENAKNLLETTSLKIIDVSLESGFNNVTYFNKIFKECTGTSPENYRKKLRNS